jgi:SAM-dependent methyltransferase
MDFNNYDAIAGLYDIYVATDFDIPFFVNAARAIHGEVLELMSGTGRISLPLLEASVHLTCLDLSAEMNAILREKLRQLGYTADVYTMDVCEMDLPKQFEMVMIPFHSFAHIVQPADQREALRRIHRHLRPGGTFICTLGNPALRRQSVTGSLRLFKQYPLENNRGSLLLWILEQFDDQDPRIVTAQQFYETYNPQGLLVSKRLMTLQFRLTAREEFEAMASDVGFRVKAMYGDYAYAAFDPDRSPYMIWIMEPF